MMPEENIIPTPDDDGDDGDVVLGVDDLLYAVADTLRSQETKVAVAKLITAFADEMERRAERNKKLIRNGYFLSAFILVVVGVLGYLKVITSESTTTLLLALLGYLFYQRRN
jgi:hypothetical protein